MAGTELIIGIAAIALIAILILAIFYVVPQAHVRQHNLWRHRGATGPTGANGAAGPTGFGAAPEVLIISLASTTGYGNNVLQVNGATGLVNVLNAPVGIVLLRQGQLVTINWPEIDFVVAEASTIVQTPVGFVPPGWRPMAPAMFAPILVSPPHAYAFPPQTIVSPVFQTGGATGIDSVGRVRLVSDFDPDAGRLQWALDSSASLAWPTDPQLNAVLDGGLTYVIPPS